MTRIFDGPDRVRATPPTKRRSTWAERAIVLAGFAIAVLHTAVAAMLDTGMETVGAAWTIAIAWTLLSSLALALRCGIRSRDWSAFRRCRLSGNDDLVSWSTRTGAYAYLRVAEEHQRLMRGD